MGGVVAAKGGDEAQAGAASEAEAAMAAHMALREVMLSNREGWLHREEGLIAAAADVVCASCNSIHVHGDADEGALAGLIAHFLGRGLPFSVNIRSGLAGRYAPVVKAAGLAHQAELPFMSLLPGEFRPVDRPDDLSIRLLPGEAEAVHLPMIVELLHLSEAGLERIFSSANRSSPAWATYLGEAEGKLAGTATAILGPLGAGLICIATDPGFGRRGFGGALTSAAIADAFARGAPRVLLHASEQGLGLYRRLGFRVFEHLSVFGAEPAGQA
jgi:ribosomal protein S18 acetylase RimI-like enzyme